MAKLLLDDKPVKPAMPTNTHAVPFQRIMEAPLDCVVSVKPKYASWVVGWKNRAPLLHPPGVKPAGPTQVQLPDVGSKRTAVPPDDTLVSVYVTQGCWVTGSTAMVGKPELGDENLVGPTAACNSVGTQFGGPGVVYLKSGGMTAQRKAAQHTQHSRASEHRIRGREGMLTQSDPLYLNTQRE